ncbi:putative GMC oxidoreductase [Rosellinia necatrix]|uniref:Putative GMC oxidoreductase n=1 Tax=Rosellinia necatrix TaxID=77044 RepID=A0A1S8AB29_ROSNE|nr:putative GMC oxidoreductase [Rosellinia necatrix]
MITTRETVQAMPADYIIIGAGTAGLVLANRLSANQNTTVVMIESGPDDRDNPNVTDPLNRGRNANTPIDWSYESVPQSQLNNRTVEFTAGKLVGGTSMINGLMYIRTAVPEIDGWEHLGATGWNWNTLWPYYKGIERFVDPTSDQTNAGAGATPEYHGRSGELAVSYPPQLLTGGPYSTLAATWEGLGIPICQDANGGKVEGFTVRPMMIDRESSTRASAAAAFYYPIAERPNLHLIRGTALSLLWRDHLKGEKQVSAGVKYLDGEGNLQSITLNPSGEVIIAAGALATPPILEASGVGSQVHLTRLGIDVRIDLPGVGENLQDQPDLTLSYIPKAPTPGSLTPYAAFVTARDVFGDKTDVIAESTEANLSTWAETVSSSSGHVGKEAIESIFRHQHDLIFKKKIAIGEITLTSSDVIASEYWSLLPFSRGSIHLRSAVANEPHKVDINPRFLQIDYDIQPFVAIGRLTQKFWATSPAADLVTGKKEPKDNEIPPAATDEQWTSYVKRNMVPNCHVLGTAAMMSRELGGVVDEALRVYGTGNVRVVDASVIPLQVTGHLVSTIYAIAARAADIILGVKAVPA